MAFSGDLPVKNHGLMVENHRKMVVSWWFNEVQPTKW